MKPLLFAFSVISAVTVLFATAKAQNYPWCAQYRGPDGPVNWALSLSSSA
jgi:hypothetical protein